MRDQPEDTLLWASKDRANTYGHWLARQVFLTGCIDPAHGMEPIERAWNLDEDLLMHVVIKIGRESNSRSKELPSWDGIVDRWI